MNVKLKVFSDFYVEFMHPGGPFQYPYALCVCAKSNINKDTLKVHRDVTFFPDSYRSPFNKKRIMLLWTQQDERCESEGTNSTAIIHVFFISFANG